jgi:hypothetical protein
MPNCVRSDLRGKTAPKAHAPLAYGYAIVFQLEMNEFVDGKQNNRDRLARPTYALWTEERKNSHRHIFIDCCLGVYISSHRRTGFLHDSRHLRL